MIDIRQMLKSAVVVVILFGAVDMRPVHAAERFAVLSDGTVQDGVTKLIWQQTPDTPVRVWKEALSFCSTLNANGHDDWRLPNIKELQSLADYGRALPALHPLLIRSNQSGARTWSSTSGSNVPDHAWEVDFADGHTYDYPKSNVYQVRCVRG